MRLGLVDAAAAAPDLMHKQEAAGGLFDVHDAVCAAVIDAHQQAQLDEEPVRVGVLLLRAVELFHALGGLLETQAYAAQELADVESLCVQPFAGQAPDRHRADAQDAEDPHDVLAEACHVCK